MAISINKIQQRAGQQPRASSADTHLLQVAKVTADARQLLTTIEDIAKNGKWRDLSDFLKQQNLNTNEVDGVINEYKRLIRRDDEKGTSAAWATHADNILQMLAQKISKKRNITFAEPDTAFVAPTDVQLHNAKRTIGEQTDEIAQVKQISNRLREENVRLRSAHTPPPAPSMPAPDSAEVQKLRDDLERFKDLHGQQAEVIRSIGEPTNKVVDGLMKALEELQTAYERHDPALIKQVGEATSKFLVEEVVPALEKVDALLETKV